MLGEVIYKQREQMKRCLILTLMLMAALVVLSPLKADAHPATGIVLDRAGNVYFSDLETIWKIDLAGKLSVFRAANGTHVHELAIDRNDNIFGAEVSYDSQKFISAIWMMRPDGTFKYLLRPTAEQPQGMSIWRDEDGNNYFLDQNNHTKTQTLLLKRTPEGEVTTLAGGAYGHADGMGTQAKFSSVGAMVFGPDGALYLTDGSTIRRVSMDGTVTTLAKDLEKPAATDKPILFGGASNKLTGIAIDRNMNVYATDAGNRRLLRISRDGAVEIVFRSEPPYFPNGVAVALNGDLYVMEVGFSLPGASVPPRVRKITPDGKNLIIAIAGEPNAIPPSKPPLKEKALAATENVLSQVLLLDRYKYVLLMLTTSLVGIGAFVWLRHNKNKGQRA
jgi:sugar lactone lactonase YvrE